MFSLRNKKKKSLNYPQYPSYLELCLIQEHFNVFAFLREMNTCLLNTGYLRGQTEQIHRSTLVATSAYSI